MQFYFAWVDPDETTFGPEHYVYDEIIFSFTRTLTEGDFATLSLEIKNPKVGLLGVGRKRWAWFAVNDGTTVTPLFFGRLVGIPSDLLDEVITIELVAKPQDYEELKAALAETLKVHPWYDKIFIDPARRSDPDTVLEGYSARLHIDPVTHEVTISDVLEGEDGVIEFTEGMVFYDSLKLTIGQKPLLAVRVESQVGWKQTPKGMLGVEFPAFTYDGPGVIGSWPKPGASLGGGWFVDTSSATDSMSYTEATLNYQFKFEDKTPNHINGDLISHEVSYNGPVHFLTIGRFTGFATAENTQNSSVTVGDEETGQAASSSQQTTWTLARLSAVHAEMTLRYEADRQLTEYDTFIVYPDIQEMLSDGDVQPDDIETIQLSATDLSEPADDTDAEPVIGSPAASSYFATARGLQSIGYGVAVARAHLRIRARCADGSFDCRFMDAVPVTLRHDVHAVDARLPGGEVTGKVVSTTLKGSGDSGEFIGSIGLGCAIGRGGIFTGSDGEPTYTDADVLGDDVQYFSGKTIVLSSGDVGFEIPPAPQADLTFPLQPAQVIVQNGVTVGSADQRGALDSSQVSGGQVTDLIGTIAVVKSQNASFDDNLPEFTYTLELKSVTGTAAANSYTHSVGPLKIPKGIDLEAA